MGTSSRTCVSAGLADWIVQGPGTALVAESPAGSGLLAAELTAGSPVTLSQIVSMPTAPLELSFDYQFLSTAGTLDVRLDSMLVGTLTAPPETAGQFATHIISLDPAFANQTAELRFTYDGPAGSQVLVDNVALRTIPEPHAAVLGILALVGLFGYVQERKR